MPKACNLLIAIAIAACPSGTPNQLAACQKAISRWRNKSQGDPEAAMTLLDYASHRLVADAPARGILAV